MKSKVLHLVGGRPAYDLTIMDFDRWGMGRAVATLRDPSVDGMNIMHRLCDRPDWVAPFPGRAHHSDWCSDVTHPDMRLIAAAPDLLAALREAECALSLMQTYGHCNGDEVGRDVAQCRALATLNAVGAAIAKATS